MEKNTSINASKSVYISYAPNSDEKPEYAHIADCVDKLKELFEANNIDCRTSDTPESDSEISAFDKAVGWQSQVMVIVFSDRYFRSLHCMYQLVQIKKALKKHPEKRLFCIKSGSFNLSDINYILDLEHYWGDQKQAYEEAEYFHTRKHTGVEKAAYENGFYMSDVRSLYSFFSTSNYAYASQEDWSGFVEEVANSYAAPSKYSLAKDEKQKTRKKHLKFVGVGCSIWLMVLAVFVAIALFYNSDDEPEVVNYKCSKGVDDVAITKISCLPGVSYILDIQLTNPYDRDTIICASRGYHLIGDDSILCRLDTAKGIAIYPDYDKLAVRDTVSFTLYFDDPGECDFSTIDFVMRPGVGIYGIEINEKEEE